MTLFQVPVLDEGIAAATSAATACTAPDAAGWMIMGFVFGCLVAVVADLVSR